MSHAEAHEVPASRHRRTPPRALSVWRHFRGLSQYELAASTGIARNTIARLERGENTPRMSTAHRIADALDLPIEIVFPDSEARPARRPNAPQEPARQGRREQS